jgi:hypothetical protein
MHASDPRFGRWLLRETGIDAPSLGANTLASELLTLERAPADAASAMPGEATAMTALVESADLALYQAKRGGKNRVAAAAADTQPGAGP